jgi:signal peptidase II
VNNSINTQVEIKDPLLKKLLCFVLTIFVFAADQVAKYLIVMFVPLNSHNRVIGDLLWIQHVRNPDAAFSLGNGLPQVFKIILFLIIPIVVIGFVVYLIVASKEVTRGQRWILAAICGGGLGNIIDRLLRPEGVVDFISVKFFGIFGFERWPTFNIADMTIVISVIILIISLIISDPKRNKLKNKEAAGK